MRSRCITPLRGGRRGRSARPRRRSREPGRRARRARRCPNSRRDRRPNRDRSEVVAVGGVLAVVGGWTQARRRRRDRSPGRWRCRRVRTSRLPVPRGPCSTKLRPPSLSQIRYSPSSSVWSPSTICQTLPHRPMMPRQGPSAPWRRPRAHAVAVHVALAEHRFGVRRTHLDEGEDLDRRELVDRPEHPAAECRRAPPRDPAWWGSRCSPAASWPACEPSLSSPSGVPWYLPI